MVDFLPSEACVYFRLLDVCNRLGWQNPFPLSNPRAVALMAMNEKTFRAVRDKLGGRGLIEFRKGKKRESPPMYCFPEKTKEGWVFPWGNFLAVKNTVKNTANTTVNTPANTPVNTPANTPAYNKTKTKTKTKIVDTPRAREECPAMDEVEKEPVVTPTLDEVRQYFRSQDAPARLNDWEESAKAFFNYFDAIGWLDKSNRPIVRWTSRANAWLCEDERRQQAKPVTNETKQTDKFSKRRGTEPRAASRKGFNGTF